MKDKKNFLSAIPLPLLQNLLFGGMLAYVILQPLLYVIMWLGEMYRCMEVQNIMVQCFGGYFLVCSVLILCNSEFHFKLKMTDVLLLLLCVFTILATIFAINPIRAFYSDGRRGESMGVILSYYLFFFAMTLLRDSRQKRNILIAFLVRGFIEGIIGFLQVYGILDLRPAGRYYDIHDIAFGFAEHFNLYGTMVCMLLALSFGCFMLVNGKGARGLFLLLSTFFFGCLIGSYTRSALVGVTMAALFFFVMELIRKKRSKDPAVIKDWGKKLGALTVCFGIVFVIFFITTDLITSKLEHMKWEQEKTASQAISFGITELYAEETSAPEENEDSGFLSDNAGSGRIYIWKRSLKLLKYYWLIGAGVDNFNAAMNHPDLPPVLPEYNLARAHNEYLHIAVTQGVFAAITYLGLFFMIFLTAVKGWLSTEEENGAPDWMVKSLALVFVGYAVQAFFNYTMDTTTPFFWLLAGMLCFRKEAFPKEQNALPGKGKTKR